MCFNLNSEFQNLLTRLGLQRRTPFRFYPLSLSPTPCSLSPSAVPCQKFRWGFLSLSLLLLLLSQAKVKSPPSHRPKTGVRQYHLTYLVSINITYRAGVGRGMSKLLRMTLQWLSALCLLWEEIVCLEFLFRDIFHCREENMVRRTSKINYGQRG